MLDLVFSNQPLTINLSGDILSNVDEYHPPILVSLQTDLVTTKKTSVRFRNFKRINWKNLNDELLEVDWPQVLGDDLNVDEKIVSFYCHLNSILDSHCPEHTVRERKFPKYFFKELIIRTGDLQEKMASEVEKIQQSK